MNTTTEMSMILHWIFVNRYFHIIMPGSRCTYSVHFSDARFQVYTTTPSSCRTSTTDSWWTWQFPRMSTQNTAMQSAPSSHTGTQPKDQATKPHPVMEPMGRWKTRNLASRGFTISLTSTRLSLHRYFALFASNLWNYSPLPLGRIFWYQRKPRAFELSCLALIYI